MYAIGTGAEEVFLAREFLDVTRKGGAAFFRGTGVPHVTGPGVETPELVLVPAPLGIDVTDWVDPGYVSSFPPAGRSCRTETGSPSSVSPE